MTAGRAGRGGWWGFLLGLAAAGAVTVGVLLALVWGLISMGEPPRTGLWEWLWLWAGLAPLLLILPAAAVAVATRFRTVALGRKLVPPETPAPQPSAAR